MQSASQLPRTGRVAVALELIPLGVMLLIPATVMAPFVFWDDLPDVVGLGMALAVFVLAIMTAVGGMGWFYFGYDAAGVVLCAGRFALGFALLVAAFRLGHDWTDAFTWPLFIVYAGTPVISAAALWAIGPRQTRTAPG